MNYISLVLRSIPLFAWLEVDAGAPFVDIEAGLQREEADAAVVETHVGVCAGRRRTHSYC